MKKAPLLLFFSIATFFALFDSALIPSLKIMAFSPFLAILYHRYEFTVALWVATLCGFGIDVFSTDLRLGFNALNYALATLLLYRQKRHFFEDKPLAISLFTALISLVSTLIQWLLIPLHGFSFPISKALIATDLLIMPLVDAFYAFIAFCFPLMLYAHIKKIGWRVLCRNILSTIYVKKPPPKAVEEVNECN